MSNSTSRAWVVDPWRFVKEQYSLDKKFTATDFDRLMSSVCRVSDAVHVHLSGYIDEHRLNVLEGRAKVTIEQVCQVCLEPFEMQLCADFKWILVDSEAAAEAFDEALVVEDKALDLISAIEDELLLSLPLIAKHSENDICKGRAVLSNYSEIEKPNPFKMLDVLLKKD